MMGDLAFYGICLIGVIGIFTFISFIKNFTQKNKKEIDHAIHNLLYGLPPVDTDKKAVQIKALLYQKIHTLYQEAWLAVNKGHGSNLEVSEKEARKFCLYYSTYLPYEIGKNCMEFVDFIHLHLVVKIQENPQLLEQCDPHHFQFLLKKSYSQLQKLKILIQEDLTQVRIQ